MTDPIKEIEERYNRGFLLSKELETANGETIDCLTVCVDIQNLLKLVKAAEDSLNPIITCNDPIEKAEVEGVFKLARVNYNLKKIEIFEGTK